MQIRGGKINYLKISVWKKSQISHAKFAVLPFEQFSERLAVLNIITKMFCGLNLGLTIQRPKKVLVSQRKAQFSLFLQNPAFTIFANPFFGSTHFAATNILLSWSYSGLSYTRHYNDRWSKKLLNLKYSGHITYINVVKGVIPLYLIICPG